MEPRIQYAKTSDSVSIAFSTLGEGAPPVILLPSLFAILRLWPRSPGLRHMIERHAQDRMVVLYDRRGQGLSQRNVADFTLEACLLDLAAVVDHLELERFALSASLAGGPPAIAYAAAHPERVSRLVLWNTYARGGDFWDAPRQKAFQAMREADWRTYSETLGSALSGYFGGPDMGQVILESATPDMFKAYMDATRGFDVTHLLPQVRCPTLVLHPTAVPVIDLEASGALASQIPGARLAVVEGDIEAVAEAVAAFLGEGEAPATVAAPSGLVTILFTDIVDSTTLTRRLGDAQAQDLLRAHNAIVRDALKSCGGAEIKHTGDGIMASFPSAARAIECAIAIQRAVATRDDALLRVRVGLNAGEPVAEEGDLFGTAVQLARRVCDSADGGAILVSNVVRELAAGKGLLFADTGEVALKGFEDPVRLYEVRWREEA